MKSIRDRLIQALEARGFKRDLTVRSSKYVVMIGQDHMLSATAKEGWRERKLFLGKAGALRTGKSASQSVPLGRDETWRQKLLSEV
jgi:hypothetical protein